MSIQQHATTATTTTTSSSVSAFTTLNGCPLPDYPRPELVRQSFVNLNGLWDYAISESTCGQGPLELQSPPEIFDGRILVPFSPESHMSGVNRTLMPDYILWYRRTVDTPILRAGNRLLLNFEAVDWECVCYVNGAIVGNHKGGYTPFSFDITDALAKDNSKIDLLVCIRDPTDAGAQPRGKQKIGGERIWYHPQSGIWQTVWMEVVPEKHIVEVDTFADTDTGTVSVAVRAAAATDKVRVELYDGGTVIRRRVDLSDGKAVARVTVDNPRTWSPDDPHLYRLKVYLDTDEVETYCAFRSVAVRTDDSGIPRLFLNGDNQPIKGVLVQGYWPDGLMTAPSDEALLRDIHAAKALGFNAIRMHVKVERRRFYYHCDKLGMLIIQDCVSGGKRIRMRLAGRWPTRHLWTRRTIDDRNPIIQYLLGARNRTSRQQWLRESISEIHLLKNHPSIVAWTLFNEGWGQYSARACTVAIKREDPTRPVDSTSGWFDQRVGDFESVHDYTMDLTTLIGRARNRLANTRVIRTMGNRALLLSEFGGLSYAVPRHCPSDGAWGYTQHNNHDAYTDAVKNALAKADALLEGILAGYIYTQLYDIEQECNGLITYDREICKIDNQEDQDTNYNEPSS